MMRTVNLLFLLSLVVTAAAADGPDKPPKDDKPPKGNNAPGRNKPRPEPPTAGAPSQPPETAPVTPPVIAPALAPASAPAPTPAPAPPIYKTNYSGLSVDYYTNICPNLESLVRGAVSAMMASSPIAASATLRLFFHDCFVTGCDASIMISNPNGGDERSSPDNQSLKPEGFTMITKAKAAVDTDPQCTNKVSCADIMALATRDAVVLSGGPTWKVELGRYDALVSRASDVDLPLATEDVPALMKRFSAQGFNVTDLVALSGGHTIGATSCFFINSRLYPTVDAYLDPGFASQLEGTCPSAMNPNNFVFFDQTVTTFDNNYFWMLQQKKGVLFSDSALYFEQDSMTIVDSFVTDQNAFFTAFVESMLKLGRLGVKTAATGEIRVNCTSPNGA